MSSNITERLVRRNLRTERNVLLMQPFILGLLQATMLNHFCGQCVPLTEESSCPLVCTNHLLIARSRLALLPSFFTTGLSTSCSKSFDSVPCFVHAYISESLENSVHFSQSRLGRRVLLYFCVGPFEDFIIRRFLVYLRTLL